MYVLLKNDVLMKEKLHEDGTKAAKTSLKTYLAKLNDTILWIRPWQKARQRSVNGESPIFGPLSWVNREQCIGYCVYTMF